MPGAQNPLPLSGLWPDESNRYPFLWVARRAVPTRSSSTESSEAAAWNNRKCGIIPPDSLFAPGIDGEDAVVQTPLACVDDLSSIRVTLHRSSEEENARQNAPTVSSAMPTDHNSELSSDPRKYSHERLSDAVEWVHIPKASVSFHQADLHVHIICPRPQLAASRTVNCPNPRERSFERSFLAWATVRTLRVQYLLPSFASTTKTGVSGGHGLPHQPATLWL